LCPKQQKNNDQQRQFACVSEITMLIKRIQNQTGYFFKKNFPASHQAAVKYPNQTGYFFKKNFPASHQAAVKYPVLKCLAMLFYSV